MEKTTYTFGRLKFQAPQNLPLQAKTYAAGRASNIKLLRLVLDFKMDYTLKILKGTSVEHMEFLNMDSYKKEKEKNKKV